MWLGCQWRHARKWWAGNLGDFLKKSSELRIETGRGESSLWATGCARVCWVSELRFWFWAESSAGDLTEERCRNSQHSKNCVSFYSCRKTKLKKSINVSYLKVVSVSGFLCIWTFYIFYVFVFWICYSTTLPWAECDSRSIFKRNKPS